MEHTSPRHVRARRLPRRPCRPSAGTRAARPRTPTRGRPSAKTQPAPSSTRGSPSRMPGSRTPRTAESAQVPTAMTATSLSCASIRSAACRRSSARRSSSARRRSASIWARSISSRALSRSKTSLRAATRTPVEAGFNLSRSGGAGGVAGEAFDGALPHPPRRLGEGARRVERGCPFEDAHWLSLKRGVAGTQARRGKSPNIRANSVRLAV